MGLIACDGCGDAFDERGYQVLVRAVPGRFHSLECAEKAYRRVLAERRLVEAYGGAALRRITGEPAPAEPTR